MSGELTGRVAIVTGAGRGIGREHALLLAAHGAAVVVNDLGARSDGESSSNEPAQQVVSEIEEAGGRAVASYEDVASAAGADELVATALRWFRRLDIVVNNAGILRDRTIVNMTDEDWDESIRVNLRGHFMPLRAAARHWREQTKSGIAVDASVINTSSESGLFGNAGQANYDAAKSGVATLTEVAAKELARYGARVNAIVPRARTRLTESIVAQAKPGRFDKWDPANVSPFVAYLARAGGNITGQVFLVGGGLVQRVAPWSLDAAWVLANDAKWTPPLLDDAIGLAGPPENTGRLTGNIR